MKKLIFLLLASFLILGACEQKEEAKTEDRKSESKKKKSEDKKKETKIEKHKKKVEHEDKTTAKSQEITAQQVDQQPQSEQVETPQKNVPQLYTESPVQQEHQNNTPSMSDGMDYNYPQENKANNPSGYISDEDVQAMADNASEYDAEVAKHNANVEAHNDWIQGQLESVGLDK